MIPCEEEHGQSTIYLEQPKKHRHSVSVAGSEQHEDFQELSNKEERERISQWIKTTLLAVLIYNVDITALALTCTSHA